MIDPYPGPLTTALSCLKSRRACVCISDDGKAFDYARGRLRIYASDSATMEDLDHFSRPVNSTLIKKRSIDSIDSQTPAASSTSPSMRDGLRKNNLGLEIPSLPCKPTQSDSLATAPSSPPPNPSPPSPQTASPDYRTPLSTPNKRPKLASSPISAPSKDSSNNETVAAHALLNMTGV